MTSRDLVDLLLKPLGYRLHKLAHGRLAGYSLTEDISILLDHQSRPVCFDLGAHAGSTIKSLLRDFDRPIITSFEPTGTTFAKLKENYGSHPDVTLVNAGVGEADGSAELNVYDIPGMNSLLPLESGTRLGGDGADTIKKVRTETITLRSIDSYCAEHEIPRIDLLKMDCQGYEMAILRGASRMLHEKRIKCLYLELNFSGLYRGEATLEELRAYLEPRGLCLSGIHNPAFRGPRLFHAEVLFGQDSIRVGSQTAQGDK